MGAKTLQVYMFFVFLSNIGMAIYPNLPNYIDSYVAITTNTSVFTLDKRFLSVAIDSGIMQRQWLGLNFSSERLFTLARGLAPSYVRFGGTAEDFLIYAGSSLQNMIKEKQPVAPLASPDVSKQQSNFTISSVDLDKIHTIAEKSGWDVLFGLNVLLRERDGTWNASNAKKIMEYVAEKGYHFGWELGNGETALF